MARPTDRGEAKTAVLNIRVTPSFKARLEAHAKIAGRKLSSEVDERLVRSVEQTESRTSPETEALLGEVERLIGEIEQATGSPWHKNVRTWAAVAEMMGTGPIMARVPAQEGRVDQRLSDLYSQLGDLVDERRAVNNRLDAINLPNELLPDYAPHQSGRVFLRHQIEKMELPQPIKEKALEAVDRLEELDSEECAVIEEIDDIVEPFRGAIEEGRKLYPKPRNPLVLRAALGRLERQSQSLSHSFASLAALYPVGVPPVLPSGKFVNYLAGAGTTPDAAEE